MSDPKPEVLIGEIEKTRKILARHRKYYETFLAGDFILLGRTTTSAIVLAELLRFRHFKRYCFEFDYDWDRLDYVQKKYEQVLPLLTRDLDAFEAFLKQLC